MTTFVIGMKYTIANAALNIAYKRAAMIGETSNMPAVASGFPGVADMMNGSATHQVTNAPNLNQVVVSHSAI